MAKRPDNTAGSAAEVLRALERALEVAARRRRLRLRLALVGAASLVALALAVMWPGVPPT